MDEYGLPASFAHDLPHLNGDLRTELFYLGQFMMNTVVLLSSTLDLSKSIASTGMITTVLHLKRDLRTAAAILRSGSRRPLLLAFCQLGNSGGLAHTRHYDGIPE